MSPVELSDNYRAHPNNQILNCKNLRMVGTQNNILAIILQQCFRNVIFSNFLTSGTVFGNFYNESGMKETQFKIHFHISRKENS